MLRFSNKVFTILVIILVIFENCNSELLNDNFITLGKRILDKDAVTLISNQKNSEYENFNNTQCIDQLKSLVFSFAQGDFWALQVVDSWGKIPYGILSGNLMELGNFEQCLGVLHDTEMAGTFNGKYCLTTISIKSPNEKQMRTANSSLSALRKIYFPNDIMVKGGSDVDISNFEFTIGLCIPATCSPDLISSIIDLAINISQLNTSFDVKLPNETCQMQKAIEFSGYEIFAIIFFSTILALMLISTIYDIIKTMNGGNRNPNMAAFSVYTNGGKIFKCNRSKSINVMDCLNGIRVLSIVWVVYGHTYFTQMKIPMMNSFALADWVEKESSVFVLGATVSVDTFFLLSGLLVAWSVLRHLDQNNGKMNILQMYVHRYLRLTPAFAAAIIYQTALMKYMGSGPLWTTFPKSEECHTYWWSALLYIQNYVNPVTLCLGHSWYLSVDMQLFILSPILIYPLWRWRNKFIWTIPVLIIISMACTFAVFMVNNYSPTMLNPETLERFKKTYVVTHTRMGAWLVGVLLGYLLHNLKGKSIRLSKITVTIGWLISLSSIFTILFSIHLFYDSSYKNTIIDNAFFESLHRVSWTIALSWIIFACVHGYGGPINWFLSWPQWQPLSRISYSLYIVHLQFQQYLAANVKTAVYFDDAYAIHKFWGDLGLCVSIALIWTMAFESPVLTLEKLLFKTESSGKSISKENLIASKAG